MMLIFFIGKYGPQKIHCVMVGQNARSIPFLEYIVIVHKGFSGIELQKYHPKDGQILKVLITILIFDEKNKKKFYHSFCLQ